VKLVGRNVDISDRGLFYDIVSTRKGSGGGGEVRERERERERRRFITFKNLTHMFNLI
jgi:hypothetical protein